MCVTEALSFAGPITIRGPAPALSDNKPWTGSKSRNQSGVTEDKRDIPSAVSEQELKFKGTHFVLIVLFPKRVILQTTIRNQLIQWRLTLPD
jgi:hypothetical protein